MQRSQVWQALPIRPSGLALRIPGGGRQRYPTVGPGDPVEPAVLLEMQRLLLARHAARGARRAPARPTELDRRLRVQPVRGGVRAATPGGRGGPVRRPLRLRQHRCVATAGPGSDRAGAVRNHPPVRGRQRARGPCPDPFGAAAPRAGAPGPTTHLAGAGDVAVGLRTSGRPTAPERATASSTGWSSPPRRACVRRAMPHVSRSGCRRSRRSGSTVWSDRLRVRKLAGYRREACRAACERSRSWR